MTIIKPEQKSFINLLLIIAVVLLLLATITFVILYNYVVNFEHNIKSMEEETKKIEIATAELNEKLFNIFSDGNLEKIVSENGLVKEKNPEYLEVNEEKWQLGLNF